MSQKANYEKSQKLTIDIELSTTYSSDVDEKGHESRQTGIGWKSVRRMAEEVLNHHSYELKQQQSLTEVNK